MIETNALYARQPPVVPMGVVIPITIPVRSFPNYNISIATRFPRENGNRAFPFPKQTSNDVAVVVLSVKRVQRG